MSAITFKQVSKRYPGAPAPTINNVGLEIADGEFCVIVGPSGCGKSTLLRMIAGLEEISAGELYIDQVRVNSLAPAERGVAMVFQSYALYPHMTVAENMAFGLKVQRADAAAAARKVDAALEALQLAPLRDRLPRELSGGQRQRVAIGRAIVKQPKVFLFDEPLSNLDAALRVQTRLEIARLHREMPGVSMVYVTHDQTEAMTLADRIVLLHAGPKVQQLGSVAQFGTPMELYHRPASRFVAEFIGSPQMNVLPATLVNATPDIASVLLLGRPVGAAVDARGIASGARVDVGIRPEHVTFDPAPDADGLPCVVTHTERLGDTSLLYVEAGPQCCQITVAVQGSIKPQVGARAMLGLPAEHLHVFEQDGRACRRTVDLPV